MYTYFYIHTHTYIHFTQPSCTYDCDPYNQEGDQSYPYIRTYIHRCIQADIHIYIHAYIHTYMRIYIHAYIHAYMHISKVLSTKFYDTHMHACKHTYMHAHIAKVLSTKPYDTHIWRLEGIPNAPCTKVWIKDCSQWMYHMLFSLRRSLTMLIRSFVAHYEITFKDVQTICACLICINLYMHNMHFNTLIYTYI
jgi:hypothetical protein